MIFHQFQGHSISEDELSVVQSLSLVGKFGIKLHSRPRLPQGTSNFLLSTQSMEVGRTSQILAIVQTHVVKENKGNNELVLIHHQMVKGSYVKTVLVT